MPTLPIYLLLGSIAWSALSVAVLAGFLVWQHEADQQKPADVQNARTLSFVRQAQSASSPEQPFSVDTKTLFRLPQPIQQRSFSRIADSAPKTEVKKVEDPSSAAHAATGRSEDVPLDYMVFDDEIIMLLDQDRLDYRTQLRALVRLMLLPDLKGRAQLLDRRGIPLLQLPRFYGRIVWKGQPVRYPRQAQQMAQALLARARTVQESGHSWREVHIPLRKAEHLEDAVRWRELIVQESRRNRLDAALVSAIVETESGFRPHARSRTGAIGLMQVKPEQAVLDVMKHSGRRVNARALLNPETNVAIGSAYLALLQRKYLAGVHDPRSREYLLVAAYNGGINAVLKQFGKTREQAIARINRLKPQQVYRILRYQFPRRETRLYLEKVVQRKARYQQWWQQHV